MGRRRQLIWAAAIAPVAAVLVVIAAWAIDTGMSGGEVVRNVRLAGHDVGGLDASDLLEHVESLDESMRDRTVRIETPAHSYETTAGEIGLSIDPRLTATAALDLGRDDPLPVRPVTWLASFVEPRVVDVRYDVDAETTRATIRALEGDFTVAPREPTIESLDGDEYRAVPGQPGAGIDADRLAVALAAAAEDSPVDEPVSVSIQESELAPMLDDQVAEAAAITANEMTSRTIAITAGDRTIELVPRELRSLARVEQVDGAIEVRLQGEDVLPVLDAEFGDLAVEPRSARFSVVGGQVRLEPAVTGVSCCSMESAEAVAEAFTAGVTSVEIELEEAEPELTTAEAEAYGIVEEVGSPGEFGPTTRHACCQNRVANIHRIADIVRGAVIPPGGTFSINEFVGRRTVEKGFVTDGVIYDGVLTQDVGGGVSQFATTLFNAALYAGLEFGEYQSHSLYISRYPRGHEATISFPHPDLQIENPTPYGVLIWPEYTDTSITVRLFSTRHAQVSVGDPTSSPQGSCTRWTTPRTRTYPDGTTEQDSVYAIYRPEEGVRC
jgi:vancomycin resistance protein YoaR